MKSMMPALEFTNTPPKAQERPRRRRRKIVSPENPKVRSVALPGLQDQPLGSEEVELVVRGAKWVSPQFEEERSCQATIEGLREQLFPASKHQPRRKNQRKKKSVVSRTVRDRGTLVERFVNGCESREGDLSCARTTAWRRPDENGRSGEWVGLEWSCARVRMWRRAGLTRSQNISLYPSVYHSTPTGGAVSRFPLSQLQNSSPGNASEGVAQQVSQPSFSPNPSSSPSPLSEIHTTVAATNCGEVTRHSSHSDCEESPTFRPSTKFHQTQKQSAEVASDTGDVVGVELQRQSFTDGMEETAESIEKTREDNTHVATKQSNLFSDNMGIQNLSDLFSSMSVDEDSANPESNLTPTGVARTALPSDRASPSNGEERQGLSSIQGPPLSGCYPLGDMQPSSLASGQAEDDYNYLENLDGFENEFASDIADLSPPSVLTGAAMSVETEQIVGEKEHSEPNSQVTDSGVSGSISMPHFKPPSSSTPFKGAPTSSGTPFHTMLPLTQSNTTAVAMECGQTRLTSDSTRTDAILNLTSNSSLNSSNLKAPLAVESRDMEDSNSTRLGSDWGSPESYMAVSPPPARELPFQTTSAIKSILKSRNHLLDSDSERFVTPRRTNKSVTFKLPLADSSGDFSSSTGSYSSILAVETPEHLWCALPCHLKVKNGEYRALTSHTGSKEGSEAAGKSETHPVIDSSAEKDFQRSLSVKEISPKTGSGSPRTIEDGSKCTPALEGENGISAQSDAQQPWDSEDNSFDVKMEQLLSQQDNLSSLLNPDAAEEDMSILAMETPAFLWASPPVNFIDGTFN